MNFPQLPAIQHEVAERVERHDGDDFGGRCPDGKHGIAPPSVVVMRGHEYEGPFCALCWDEAWDKLHERRTG